MGAVTVSFTGAENQFQVNDNGHVGRPCEVSLAPPYPELFRRLLRSGPLDAPAAHPYCINALEIL